MVAVYGTKSSESARLEQQLQIALQQIFADLRELVVSIIEADGEISGAFWSQQRSTLALVLTPVVTRALQASVAVEVQGIAQRGGASANLDMKIGEAAQCLVNDIVADVLESVSRQVEALLDDPNRPLEFSALSEQRAELIAITETTRIMSTGQLLAWKATRPIVKVVTDPPYVIGKRWRVMPGEKVCPICAPLDGIVTGLDERFERETLAVDVPPAHPRCRYWLEPVWSDEALTKPTAQEGDDSEHPETYPELCEWLPPSIGGICGDDAGLARFRNLLGNIYRLAWNRAPVAARLLAHYLDGYVPSGQSAWMPDGIHRVPMFVNPHQIFANPLFNDPAYDHLANNGLTISEMLSDQFLSILAANGTDPATLFNGLPLTEFVDGDNLIYVANAVAWNYYQYRFTGENLEFAFGFARVEPVGNMMIVYRFDVERQMISMSLIQEVQVSDRYDWNGTPIAYNPSTGTVRLNSFDDPSTGIPIPPLEIDPETNEIIAVLVDNDQVVEGNFTLIPYPPDSPDLGAVAGLYFDHMGLVDPAPNRNSAIFGSADHPNVFVELGFGFFGGDTGFPSGAFHLLEGEGTAGPFYVYSSWRQTNVYEIPFSVSDTGEVIVEVDVTSLQPIVSIGESIHLTPTDNAVVTLQESGFEPITPYHETDTQPH
jgi:hypothetical protein